MRKILALQKLDVTPGDGLFRSLCDYTTGLAGVMRALHRFAHLEESDFVLDEKVGSTR